MIRVLFVCHGNICRSTMAQSVLTHLVKQEGLAGDFIIESAATSCEEIGSPPHKGTVDKLRCENIPLVPHRAVRMTKQDYEKQDYLIGMDSANIRNMIRICGGDPKEKIHKILEFCKNGMDVADPWYTGDFDGTYRDILAGCRGFLRFLRARGKI